MPTCSPSSLERYDPGLPGGLGVQQPRGVELSGLDLGYRTNVEWKLPDYGIG
jgi:hypothetical protein